MLKAKSVNIIFSSLLIISILSSVLMDLSLWITALIILLWLIVTAVGSFNIELNYHLKSLNSNPNSSKNQVAITFDDSPNPTITPKILNLLEKYQAKATFFCVGKHMEIHREITQEIISKGHTIGNHTYSHSPFFGFFNTHKVVTELQKTNTIIFDCIQKKPLLYRPVYGVTNPSIKKAVKRLNLISIGWNVRSLDTVFSINQVMKRIKKTQKGDIILLHDHSEKNLVILEQFLQFLSQQNLTSVTVDELLNVKAYE